MVWMLWGPMSSEERDQKERVRSRGHAGCCLIPTTVTHGRCSAGTLQDLGLNGQGRVGRETGSILSTFPQKGISSTILGYCV